MVGHECQTRRDEGPAVGNVYRGFGGWEASAVDPLVLPGRPVFGDRPLASSVDDAVLGG